MTQEQITMFNLGQSLDDLANIDPRGYGICKILYQASRTYTGSPISMNAAQKLVNTVKQGDVVYIMTGFVLWPYKKAETDGIVSAMFLCRALVTAFGAKPIVVCPSEDYEAVKNVASCIGLHFCETIDELLKSSNSIGAFCFTKDVTKASEQTELIIKEAQPIAVISIECAGANRKGVYHNAKGRDVSELEAKQDILFEKIKEMGVLNIAIGDLGNEIGMGTLIDTLENYIPYAQRGACNCSCGEGIVARTKADNIITATISDWGCYAMIASMAYLMKDIEIMHTAELEKEVLICVGNSDIIDMNGSLIPAIDGVGLEINMAIVCLMRELVKNTLDLRETCKTWFEKVDELEYFDEVIPKKC